MGIMPVVRHMILCDHWEFDDANQNRVNIFGLMSYLFPTEFPPYPAVKEKLCVFLALTEVRGRGRTHIRCVFEASGQTVFRTAEREIEAGGDPLAIDLVAFHIHGCPFPEPGIYSIQFWYNDEMVHECPLRLRRPR